jgi:hypothetical protein
VVGDLLLLERRELAVLAVVAMEQKQVLTEHLEPQIQAVVAVRPITTQEAAPAAPVS